MLLTIFLYPPLAFLSFALALGGVTLSGVVQDLVNGGFGGGPQQLPHGAPMYASVLSLLLIGTPEAYGAIDRCVLLAYARRSNKREATGWGWHL